jgi:hypothetical protein
MKYSDVVSGLVAVLSLPFTILKGVLVSLPTLSFVTASNCECDTVATCSLYVSLGISWIINTIEKYWIYLLSNIFYPCGICNYMKNKKVIDYLRENVTRNNTNYNQLSHNARNAIAKEGFCEIFLKMISMFTILPTYKHAFLNNPFLFEYEMYLTNQETKPFNNKEKMSKILFSYITDPEYVQLEEKKDGAVEIQIDDIQFTPNYFNNSKDNTIDYNNIGMQVANKYTTFIYLETIKKDHKELYEAITNKKTDKTFMNPDHEVYNTLKDGDINIVYNVPNDNEERYKFLDLVVEYDDMYHPISGMVEANVRSGNVVEHPMLCLYHDGSVMKYTWDVINDLFTNRVMKYLKQLDSN